MWTLKPEERLRDWYTFRQKIGQMPIDLACKEVVHLWSYAPYVNYYLDPTCLEGDQQWPDPWTLIYENYYCDLAKSLGMLYTLYLSEHKSCEMEIIIASDYQTRMNYNLVDLGQGKYILNFMFDTVVNKAQLPKSLKVLYRYTPADLNLNVY